MIFLIFSVSYVVSTCFNSLIEVIPTCTANKMMNENIRTIMSLIIMTLVYGIIIERIKIGTRCSVSKCCVKS